VPPSQAAASAASTSEVYRLDGPGSEVYRLDGPGRQFVEGPHSSVKDPIIQAGHPGPVQAGRSHIVCVEAQRVGGTQGGRKVVAQQQAMREQVGAGEVEDSVLLHEARTSVSKVFALECTQDEQSP
jgi:hypothetical protein